MCFWFAELFIYRKIVLIKLIQKQDLKFHQVKIKLSKVSSFIQQSSDVRTITTAINMSKHAQIMVVTEYYKPQYTYK